MEDVPVWAVRPNVEVLNHRSVIFRQINKDTREPIMMPWSFQTGRPCC
jgi:hypothetical protein